MTVRKLAEFYLRFWHRGTDRQWNLADNAPPEFWRFLATNKLDRNLVHEGLASIAGDAASLEVPSTTEMLRWASSTPHVITTCDELLASRQPPKTVGTLLRQVYLSEVSAARSVVRTFLIAEIDKY